MIDKILIGIIFIISVIFFVVIFWILFKLQKEAFYHLRQNGLK